MLRLPHRFTAHSQIPSANSFDIQKGEKRWLLMFALVVVLVILRLGYWQVIRHEDLQAQAEAQYLRTITSDGARGTLWTADGYPLVTNEQRYRLYTQPYRLKQESDAVAAKNCQALPDLQPDCDDIRTKLRDKDSK